MTRPIREAFSRLSLFDTTLLLTAVLLAAALCGSALTIAAENNRLRAEAAYWQERYLDRVVALDELQTALWEKRRAEQ